MAAWLKVTGFGLDDWIYWHLRLLFTGCWLHPTNETELQLNCQFWVWVLCYDRISRPVCLGIKHPSGAYDQIFITVSQLRVCWYGTLSLTRGRVCSLQLLVVLARAVILGSESRVPRDHILLSQILDWPFVTSYDSQDHGGGIRHRLQTGLNVSIFVLFSFHRFGSDHSIEITIVALQWIYANHIENTSCDTGFIVACVYCGRCLEMVLLYCWLIICYGLVYRVVP
jgi:hypothetical protein